MSDNEGNFKLFAVTYLKYPFPGGDRLRRGQAVAERALLPEDAGSFGQAEADRAGYPVAR